MKVRKINEDTFYGPDATHLEKKITVLRKRGVSLKNVYDSFEDFYNDISPDGYGDAYEDYIENEDNTVTLTFENGGEATFKIELNTMELFQTLKEEYE